MSSTFNRPSCETLVAEEENDASINSLSYFPMYVH